MKFEIHRTSSRSKSDQPCEGAVWEFFPPAPDTSPSEAWFIEVSTLEELLELSDRTGCELIVGDFVYPSIELYDDRRE